MKVNLGCGLRGKIDGYINCDGDWQAKPDKIMDVRVGLDPAWRDECEEIRCENLLDSLTHSEATSLIGEIYRSLKEGGSFVFHQMDVAKNPRLGLGWPHFVSGYTDAFFYYFLKGAPEHETWKDQWMLPGFKSLEIEHNDNGVMIGRMVK